MRTHRDIATLQEKSERSAPGVPGRDVVASPRPCPVCGEPMPGRRRSACSDKCRATKTRTRRVPLPVSEAQAIRASLTAIIDAAWEAKATLEMYGCG
jgi:predicted nucleic acid-binding Zn ribbon protein